ncbi:hypothetical protein LPJ59_001907, partial [Coemansia sp. RSA 2399]
IRQWSADSRESLAPSLTKTCSKRNRPTLPPSLPRVLPFRLPSTPSLTNTGTRRPLASSGMISRTAIPPPTAS